MAISIKSKGIEKTAAARPAAADRPKQPFGMGFLRGLRKPVKSRELMFFTSQLSLMLEIQTPLTKALKAVGDEIKNPI
jgi:type II secretory pathway component PulF